MLVRTRMTPEVITATPQTTLAEALQLTREHGIRHIPVLAGDRVVGLVTDRDLRMALPPVWMVSQDEQRQFLSSRTVEDLMVAELVTTDPETPIEEAAKLFYQNKIGCVLVMEGEQLAGILTSTDLLRAFVDLFGANQPSCRIEIRLPNRPGELSRVVRLIGIDYKLNITGMVVPPIPDSKEAQAIIHVATRQRPDELIESLEKMGYRVGSPVLRE